MRSSSLFLFPALAAFLFTVLIHLSPSLFRPVASLPIDPDPSSLLGTATVTLGGGTGDDTASDTADDAVGSGIEESAEGVEEFDTVASFDPLTPAQPEMTVTS